MKICKVNNYTFPARDAQGTQRMLEALSKELVRQGHEVSLFFNQDSVVPEQYGKLVSKVPENVDVVHFHGGIPIEYGLDLKKPWISTAHGGAVDTPERMKEVGKYVNNLVFVSKFCSQMYNSKCFIWNGVGVDDFVYREKKDDYFLWMAGTDWGEQKGLFSSILLAKKLGIKLKIAGGGKNQSIIDEVKKSCNSKIEYLGFVNGKEKVELLAGARALFMIGGILDACPLSSIEAWASGTPIIARNIGVHPEIICPDVGYVCSTSSEIMRSIVTIDKIKPENCRKYFLENFTSEIVAKKYVKVYQNVIEKGSVNTGERP